MVNVKRVVYRTIYKTVYVKEKPLKFLSLFGWKIFLKFSFFTKNKGNEREKKNRENLFFIIYNSEQIP